LNLLQLFGFTIVADSWLRRNGRNAAKESFSETRPQQLDRISRVSCSAVAKIANQRKPACFAKQGLVSNVGSCSGLEQRQPRRQHQHETPTVALQPEWISSSKSSSTHAAKTQRFIFCHLIYQFIIFIQYARELILDFKLQTTIKS